MFTDSFFRSFLVHFVLHIAQGLFGPLVQLLVYLIEISIQQGLPLLFSVKKTNN
jgi:hypothetical protein